MGTAVSLFETDWWRANDRAMWQLFANESLRPELEQTLFQAAKASALQSGMGVSFERINDAVRLLARDRAFELINVDGPENVVRPTLDFLDKVRDELAEGILAWSDLRSRLSGIFGPYRARRIAVTETTTLWAHSHLAAAIAAGMTHKRSRRATHRRRCPSSVCNSAEEENWIPIQQLFRQARKQAPAYHPHCYCYLRFKAVRH